MDARLLSCTFFSGLIPGSPFSFTVSGINDLWLWISWLLWSILMACSWLYAWVNLAWDFSWGSDTLFWAATYDFYLVIVVGISWKVATFVSSISSLPYEEEVPTDILSDLKGWFGLSLPTKFPVELVLESWLRLLTFFLAPCWKACLLRVSRSWLWNRNGLFASLGTDIALFIYVRN